MHRLKQTGISSFGSSSTKQRARPQQQEPIGPWEEFLRIKSDRANSAAAKAHRLNIIIGRMHKTELHIKLPEILLFIFSLEGSHQDRLEFMSPRLKNANVNEEIVNLLHPKGALLQQLMDYAYDTEELTYQFTKDNLPLRTQRFLNSPAMMNSQPNAFVNFALSPNMFEFYLMTFSSAILKRSRMEKNSDPTAYTRLLVQYMEYFFPVVQQSMKAKLPNDDEIPIQAHSRRQKLTERFWLIFTEFWVDDEGCDAVSLNHVQVLYKLIEHAHGYLFLPMANSSAYLNSGFFDLERNIGHLRPRIFKFLWNLMSRKTTNINEATFDQVARLWLVWVRPWRYRVQPGKPRNPDNPFSNAYDGFVKENLECYTTLFIKYIERVLSSWLRCDVAYDIQDLNTRFERMRRICDVIEVFSRNWRLLGPVILEAEKVKKKQSHTSPTKLNFTTSAYVSLTDTTTNSLRLSEEVQQLLSNLYSRVKRSIAELNEKKRFQSKPETTHWLAQMFDPQDGKQAKHDKMKQDLLSKLIVKSMAINNSLNVLGITEVVAVANDLQPLHHIVNPITADPIHKWRPSFNEMDVVEVREANLMRVWSQPVRSYESASLVRLMFTVSSYLNDKFECRPWFFDDFTQSDDYLNLQLAACIKNKSMPGTSSKTVNSAFVLVQTDATLFVLKSGTYNGDILETKLTETDMGYTLDGRVNFIDVFELISYYQSVPYGIDTQSNVRYFLKQFPREHQKKKSLKAQINALLFPINLRCLADQNFQITSFFTFLFFILLLRFTSTVFVLFTISLIGLGFILVKFLTQPSNPTQPTTQI